MTGKDGVIHFGEGEIRDEGYPHPRTRRKEVHAAQKDAPLHPMIRLLRLIRNAIETFGLNLSGQTVLTEAATGHFSVTPAIALLAGAERVLCLTRDSKYGSTEDAREEVSKLIKLAGLKQLPDIFLDRRKCPVEEADIVTNLGFVRPLDRSFIERMKSGAVISLMWEPWALRPAEIDIPACRERGVLVVGTDEQDHRLQTFRYLGLTVMKVLFDLQQEVLGNRYILLSDCPFGAAVAGVLKANGANARQIDVPEWLSLRNGGVQSLFQGVDAFILLVHRTDRPLLNSKDTPHIDKILAVAPDLRIVHVSGNIDFTLLQSAAMVYTPAAFSPPFYMSINPSWLGPKPVVDLHTAGLHVGSACFRLRKTIKNPADFIFSARRTAPVLEVTDEKPGTVFREE